MRTSRALRAEVPPPAAAERLSDAVLLAAPENPDHSPNGRRAALDALMARGIAPEPWRLRVPGFVKRESLERRGERLFFGAGRALRKWSGAATLLTFLAMLIAVFVLVPAKEEVLRDAQAAGVADVASLAQSDLMLDSPSFAPVAEALGPEHGALQRAVWAERIGIVFAGVFGAVMLLWIVSSALRRHPARLLLLRKFNVKSIGKPLGDMIQHELRPYGHVCSLSDKHIRRSRFGWISNAILIPGNPVMAAWFIIGTPLRAIYRLFDRSRMGPAFVANARDYRNLARRLRDRVGLNVQVATTEKESFLVRTSDAWWKMVVRLLMDSSDAIVVDLSQVTEGTAWELDVIREEGASHRCVFVALWGKGEEAEAALKRWGFSNPCHFYAPDGRMVKRTPFRADVLAAIRVTHGITA